MHKYLVFCIVCVYIVQFGKLLCDLNLHFKLFLLFVQPSNSLWNLLT